MTQSVTKSDHSSADSCAVTLDQVEEMTHELFGPMFGIPIETSSRCNGDPDASAWQASVTIDGEWNAEVQTIIPEKLASQIACTMFSMTPDELTDGDMQDAMGEVVNIIGGNIKGIVGLESNLSLPCVAQFQDLLAGSDLTASFDCEREQLLVLVKQN